MANGAAHLKKIACPNCGAHELFDATVTSDYPDLFMKYPDFRGTPTKKKFCCMACKTVVKFKLEEGLWVMRSWQTPTEGQLANARSVLSGEQGFSVG